MWHWFTYVSYLLVGPLTWLGVGFVVFAGRRKMLLLAKPRPAPAIAPKVTILIPAKDEGERIRGCIESALAQDYPDFNVIAIDDRSDDNTGQIMDQMTLANPRLQVLHIPKVPLGLGWTGKNNALFNGAKRADGQWLCFVDSDVILQPAALARTIAVCEYKKYDMISLLPKLESHTLWESSLVPLAAAAASMMYLIALNNTNHLKNTAFANGQYLMIRRKVYDSFGGHETVKDRYCEDVGIASIVKRMGYRPRVAWGNEVSAVRMYSSLASIIRGWSRIYYAARIGSPWRTLSAIGFLFQNCFTLYPALIWGLASRSPWWLGASILHALVMGTVLGIIYHWSGNKARNALFFPVAGSVLLWIMMKSVVMCFTKKVEWRGTNYAHQMASDLTVPK